MSANMCSHLPAYHLYFENASLLCKDLFGPSRCEDPHPPAPQRELKVSHHHQVCVLCILGQHQICLNRCIGPHAIWLTLTSVVSIPIIKHLKLGRLRAKLMHDTALTGPTAIGACACTHVPLPVVSERLARPRAPPAFPWRKSFRFSLSRTRAARGAAARATRAHRSAQLVFTPNLPRRRVNKDGNNDDRRASMRSSDRVCSVVAHRFSRCRRRNSTHSSTQRTTEGDQRTGTAAEREAESGLFVKRTRTGL